MVKAFENYEVWFVTGAQLLYGGFAVTAVDDTKNSFVHIVHIRISPNNQ